MKAVVKYEEGPAKVELLDMPEPKAGRGEVKIKVEYVGICGTDLHIYHDHYQHKPPVIMGHEFSGSVVEVGEEVSRLKVGDPVTSEPFARVCGKCLNCRTSNYNLCLERLSAGSGLNGGMASYCVMPEERVHLLPPGVGYKEGAIAEPLACCVHAVLDRGRIKPGDLVIVNGPGIVGLLSLQLAKLSSATVILVGTKQDAQRLELGSALGADYTVDDVTKLDENLTDLTDSFGADLVIECAGHERSLIQAMEAVRKGGTIVQVGLFGKDLMLPFDHIIMKEIKLLGAFGSNWRSWTRALKLLSSKEVNVEPLVDSVLPLHSWAAAFKKTENREAIKILLKPD